MAASRISNGISALTALAVQRRSQVEDAPTALLAPPDRLAKGGARAQRVGEGLNNAEASRVEQPTAWLAAKVSEMTASNCL